jgi:predicted P-loop ATPase
VPELSLLRREKSREALKRFLSQQKDTVRLSYRPDPLDYLRRCVFIGTTNDENYLEDPTGLRRFWPVKVQGFDLGALARDREQLWAEALVSWNADPRPESLVLPEALWSAQAAAAGERRIEDPWRDIVAQALETRFAEVTELATADIAEKVLGFQPSLADGRKLRRLRPIMLSLGWSPAKVGRSRNLAGYTRDSSGRGGKGKA